MLDAYLIAGAIGNDSGEFPHLVYGLDVEAFRPQQVINQILAEPELRDQLPRKQRIDGELERIASLVDLRNFEVSARMVRMRLQGTLRTEKAHQFRSDGYRTDGPVERARQRGQTFEQQYDHALTGYRTFYEGGGRELDADARRWFERFLATANEHGDAPTIFLTPMHPRMADDLAGAGREERMEVVRDYLRSLEDEYDFTWYDYTAIDSFGGTESDWFDGVHPDVANTRRLLAQLAKDEAATGGAGQ
jgi:hypothetical protein